MKKILLALFALSALSAGAADFKTGVDNFYHGKKSSAANKDIVFELGLGSANPKIRGNKSTSKIEFAQDGTTFSDLSAGGSSQNGGFNLLTSSDNAGFEAGTTGWTASGGSFTTTTSNPFFGTTSALFDASALNQTLSSGLKAIPVGLNSKACQAAFQYSFSGSTGDYAAEIYDGSSTIATVNLTASATPVDYALNFTCPASGSILIRLRAGVANPSAIKLDGHSRSNGLIYLGAADGLTNAVSSVYSEVTVYNYAYPSCGGTDLTFSTTLVNVGSDILYTRDTVNGDTMTIMTDGVYFVASGVGYLSTAQYSAIATGLGVCTSTSPLAIPAAQIVAIAANLTVNSVPLMARTAYFTAGTVIKVHATGNALDSNTGITHQWNIAKLSN